MNEPAQDLTQDTTLAGYAANFVRLQVLRAVFRLLVLALSVVPVLFWAGVAVLFTKVDGTRWEFPFFLALSAWLGLLTPSLVVHAALAVDVLNWAFARKVLLFPLFQRTGDLRHLSTSLRITSTLAQVAGYTSPLHGLALWSYGVLARVPKERYASAPEETPAPRARGMRPVPSMWGTAKRAAWRDLRRMRPKEAAV